MEGKRSRTFNVLRRDVKTFVSWAIRGVARRVLQYVPVAIWRRVAPQTTFGLCYHVVSDAKLQHLKHYPPLTTAQFEEDLSYLKGSFSVIAYDELVRRRSVENIVRDNAATLTFDDGFAECATVVRPILLRHGASCIFFVITDLIDNRVMFRETQASLCIDAIWRQPVECVEAIIHELGLDEQLPCPPVRSRFKSQGWSPLDVADFDGKPDSRLRSLLHWLLTIRLHDVGLVDRLCDRLGVDVAGYLLKVRPYLSTEQICQLHSDGFTIGAHGRSHRRLESLSRAEAEHEIVESCRIVRDLTGQESVPFAFPYSGAGLDRTWLAQLRERHDFIGLFFDTGGLRRDAPFVVQRVFGERINQAGSMDSILRRAWTP